MNNGNSTNFNINPYVSEPEEGFKYNFLASFAGSDYISSSESFYMKGMSLLAAAEEIRKFINKIDTTEPLYINGLFNGVVMLQNKVGSDSPIIITLTRHRSRSTSPAEDNISIDFCASPTLVGKLLAHFDEEFTRRKNPTIHWWFISKNQNQSIDIQLKNTSVIHPEYYPFIEPTPEEYFQAYLDSNAPLLFLSGPPGTGKTTFLRAMIAKNNLHSYVAYDPKLFQNDEMFIAFLSSEKVKVLIMEDAEEVVKPRDAGGNNMMSRFLNVSDGLIPFPGKKLIFSTNESSFESIDQALIRPGRCHDFLEFRKLDRDESTAAIKAGNLPEQTLKSEMSIAELFNPKTRVRKKRTVGFLS
jgi:hypothetical protein